MGNEYEGDGGDINDSIALIMINLKEMNRLWIRIKSIRQFKKSVREKQRMDLKVTVGENVVRLSRMEGVNLEMYQTTLLPALIKLVRKTKDFMSQQYLLDCIISAFPDEYHLHTLETILTTCCEGINPKCDVKVIFIRLMERLADFCANSEALPLPHESGLDPSVLDREIVRLGELTNGVLSKPDQIFMSNSFSAHSRLPRDHAMHAVLDSGFRHMYIFTWVEQDHATEFNERLGGTESGQPGTPQVQIGNVWLDGH